MPLVVADAGPLHYLVLTGDIELLQKLFERVLVPQVVRDELANTEAPRPCATGSRVRQAGLTCSRLIRAPTMLPWRSSTRASARR
jgi:predicted nucleic acid-binding protein